MSSHNILQALYSDGTPYDVKDPGDAGTLIVDRQFAQFKITTVSTETNARTLAQPTKANIICNVTLDVDGGDLTLTVTGGYNADAATSITFADAGDFVTFISIEVGTSYYWRVLAQEGTNVAGEDLTVDQATVTTLGATTATLTNATLGRMQVTQTAVTAAGSAIGNAAALSYGMNIVGAADNSKGVILPVAVANAVVEIISTVNAKSLLIYPQVNSAISGLAPNAALTLGASNTGAAANAQLNSVRLVATNATQWYVASGA
jgi:hypothetical protein